MNAVLNTYFSPKHFLIGLGVVAALYVLLFGYLFLRADHTLEQLQSTLVTDSAVIERTDFAAPLAEIEEPQQEQAEEQSADALFPAPLEGLYEDTRDGRLPKISRDGATPFKAYRKPFIFPGKPLIAIGVLDYGLSESNASAALKDLPDTVSLILSPYAAYPEKWQKLARKNGHEVWLSAPAGMADFPDVDPGPQALLSHAGPKYNTDRLKWIMSRTTGYAGLALGTDDVFASNATLLNTLLDEIHQRGLGVLETNVNAPAFTETYAVSENMPFIASNIYVRDTSLKALEKQAKEQGYVVALVDSHPSAIKALKIWLNTLPAKGLAAAPLSAIAEVNPLDTPTDQQ